MGKFFAGVFEVIVGTVLLFVPGLQAAGIALIAGGLLQLAATLLMPSPQKPKSAISTVRDPTPPRVSAYGRSRLYGALIFYEAHKNRAADVFAFHDGLIDGIERIYLGDQEVFPAGFTSILFFTWFRGRLSAPSNWEGYQGTIEQGPDGEFANNVSIHYRHGLETETYFSQINTEFGESRWDESHRGDGVATGLTVWQAAKAKNYAKTFPNGQPAQSWVARWQAVYDWRDPMQSLADKSTWKWSENVVLHAAHYELIRNNKSWAIHFAPTLAYWTAAADDCDTTVPLKGIQTTLTKDYSTGATHVQLLSTNGLYVGMTVSISSLSSLTVETKVVSAVDSSTNIITITALAHDHARNSAVKWLADPVRPPIEPRYRSSVAHAHTDKHADVMAAITMCGDLWISPRSDGALVCYSGRYYEPTVSIGPDEILAYSIAQGIEDENALNQIIVKTISADHDYSTVECDPWQDTDDILARGAIRSDELNLQIPSFSQGRRLAKRKMHRVMAPFRGTIATNSGGRVARGQRYVNLLIEEAGTVFYDGPVEIIQLTRNVSTGGLTFQWVSADPAIDDWDPIVEEGNPAPIGNSLGARSLTLPTITSTSFSGGRITVNVTGPDQEDVTWFTRWRVLGSDLWTTNQYDDQPAPDASLLTGFVTTGTTVEVEVSYSLGNGQVSDWTSPSVHVTT